VTAGRRALLEEVHRLATDCPRELTEALAQALEHIHPAGSKATALSAIPQVHYRAMAARLLEAWHHQAPDLSPQTVALALLAAAHTHDETRRRHTARLVWTGPHVKGVPPRRTEQALLQVIGAAARTLTVVSFVAYKVPVIRDALAAAARRGVTVRLVVEDPEASDGKVAFDALQALGADVAERSTVYIWPLAKRPKDSAGNHGSLHAKCAVADGTHLLVSSANLTQHAFTLNLELGILLRGGPLPVRVERYLDSLIHAGTLVAVQP
jgi:phosphatidylserine/phosphatidylglycerophosphate/cardiolipin synthase-like enzyme